MHSHDWLPKLGTLLDGHYRLDEQLGVGVNGAVYRALELQSGEPVVIKMLAAHLLEGDLRRTNLFRLTRTLTQEHDHLARVLDVVQRDEWAFVVYEPTAGVPLGQYIRSRPPLLNGEVLELFEGICAALMSVHSRGAIHGNLKPNNVLVDQGRVTLVDGFQLLGSFPSSEAEAVFLAPEQRGGVDAEESVASDVWASGLLLGYVLARSPVHPGVALSAQGPGISSALDPVFLRATEMSPRLRTPNIEHFLSALREALPDDEVDLETVGIEIEEDSVEITPADAVPVVGAGVSGVDVPGDDVPGDDVPGDDVPGDEVEEISWDDLVDVEELDAAELDSAELEPVELEPVELESVELESVELEPSEPESVELDVVELDAVELDAVDLDAADGELEVVAVDEADDQSTAIPEMEIVDLTPVDLTTVDLTTLDLDAEPPALEAVLLDETDELEVVDGLEAVELEAEAVELESVELEPEDDGVSVVALEPIEVPDVPEVPEGEAAEEPAVLVVDADAVMAAEADPALEAAPEVPTSPIPDEELSAQSSGSGQGASEPPVQSAEAPTGDASTEAESTGDEDTEAEDTEAEGTAAEPSADASEAGKRDESTPPPPVPLAGALSPKSATATGPAVAPASGPAADGAVAERGVADGGGDDEPKRGWGLWAAAAVLLVAGAAWFAQRGGAPGPSPSSRGGSAPVTMTPASPPDVGEPVRAVVSPDLGVVLPEPDAGSPAADDAGTLAPPDAGAALVVATDTTEPSDADASDVPDIGDAPDTGDSVDAKDVDAGDVADAGDVSEDAPDAADVTDVGDVPDVESVTDVTTILPLATTDVGVPDTDAGPTDAGPTDAGPTDAGADAGPTDAGADAGPTDAGADAGPVADVAEVPPGDRECPGGMIRISRKKKTSAKDASGKAIVHYEVYCIDRREYPGAGTPRTNISLWGAKAACERRGKRLCSGQEWRRACGSVYPYGRTYDPDKCNTMSLEGDLRVTVATGSFSGCRSAWGGYDMVGNVAEWTADGRVRGGDSYKTAERATCGYAPRRAPSSTSSYVGFRCCADATVSDGDSADPDAEGQ